MSDSSEPSGTTQVVQNNDPWSEQRPYLQDVFKQAQDRFNATGPAYFPNSTVVPFSNQTQQALQMQENRALAGSPLLSSAQGQTQNMINGDFLSAGNPYFSAMSDRVAENVMPRVSAQFEGSGRYGSPGMARAASMGMTDALGSLAYQNYGDERKAMNSAISAAPTLAAADYMDIGQLANVGQMREGQAGAELQDQISRYNYEQGLADDKLARYAALVAGGSFGGTQTATQPIFSNDMATYGGLGLGAIGAMGTLFGQGGVWPGALGK